MRDWARRGGGLFLASAIAASSSLAPAQPSSKESGPGKAPASATIGPQASARTGAEETHRRPGPIAESIGPAVDAFIHERMAPCRTPDRAGVPCFPVSVERKWQYSVADSLAHLEFDERPGPNRPPTLDEMKDYRPGALSAYGNFVTFDPVCKTKQLFKMITGASRTYYLYRTWDAGGEHVTMRDRPLEAGKFDAASGFGYVPLGSFKDECEAVAAWRKALRETAARRQAAADVASDAGEPADAPRSSSPEPPRR